MVKQEVKFNTRKGPGKCTALCHFTYEGHELRVREWGEMALQASVVRQRCSRTAGIRFYAEGKKLVLLP